MMLKFFILAVVCVLPGLAIGSAPIAKGMVRVEGGTLFPFYPPSPKEKEIPVKTFLMDKAPVTNAQFLDFVGKNPEWRRDRIKRLFADDRYLSQWANPLSLGDQTLSRQPVTQVSWFAAKAYCESEGKRLPTENEWEYAAQASEKEKDGRHDMSWRTQVLDWYTTPAAPALPEVGKRNPNYWGLYDLHGLVWEWVLDFNSSLISGDNRENAESPDKTRFCGAGAQVATEKEDYASFMRIAFRTSLKARYTTKNLGFRCAGDLP